MKISQLLSILFFGALLIISCNNKKEDPAPADSPITTIADPTLTAHDPAAATDPAATSVSGGKEPHYKCPKGCKGGEGAAQGKCPVCGTDLVHNQAFHAQAAAGSSPNVPITIDPTNGTAPTTPPTTGTQTTQTIKTTPDQNAAGVWHYTCSKGCAGGAGSAGNCAKCGNPLTHNQEFHKQ